MNEYELSSLGRQVLHPDNPLRWVRNPDYSYNLHRFTPQPNGKYNQEQLDIQSGNPYSEGLFKHVPVIDNYGLTHDTAAPDLFHGSSVTPEQQSHWLGVYDKINSAATAGSLNAEKFARMYKEALK